LPSVCHHHSFLLLKHYSPHRFGRLAEFTNQSAGFEVPDLDAAVGASRDDVRLVELERGYTVVMCGEAVNWRKCFERPDTNGAVGSTSTEDGVA